MKLVLIPDTTAMNDGPAHTDMLVASAQVISVSAASASAASASAASASASSASAASAPVARSHVDVGVGTAENWNKENFEQNL